MVLYSQFGVLPMGLSTGALHVLGGNITQCLGLTIKSAIESIFSDPDRRDLAIYLHQEGMFEDGELIDNNYPIESALDKMIDEVEFTFRRVSGETEVTPQGISKYVFRDFEGRTLLFFSLPPVSKR